MQNALVSSSLSSYGTKSEVEMQLMQELDGCNILNATCKTMFDPYAPSYRYPGIKEIFIPKTTSCAKANYLLHQALNYFTKMVLRRAICPENPEPIDD